MNHRARISYGVTDVEAANVAFVEGDKLIVMSVPTDENASFVQSEDEEMEMEVDDEVWFRSEENDEEGKIMEERELTPRQKIDEIDDRCN